MIHRNCERFPILVIAFLASSLPLIAGDQLATRSDQIQQLDSPFYSQRQAAFRSLLKLGTDPDTAIAEATVSAVRDALNHPSVEVRLAAGELLDQIRTYRMDANLAQLRDPSIPGGMIEIEGWKSFSQQAGSDMRSRRFFVRLVEQYPSSMSGRFRSALDPLHLQRDDTFGWAMVLWIDLQDKNRQRNRPQLGVLLSQTNLGPTIDKQAESQVLSRMIGKWLEQTPATTVPVTQKLRIALRYNQPAIANRLIDEVFADPRAWPESRISALLAACVLDRDDTVGRAAGFLQDRRTGCVWNLIATEKRRIRTQVRDVAMAVLLQTRSIDPRSAGFEYLEADALFIFRDHSLGFPDEDARDLAHQRAADLLERITISR